MLRRLIVPALMALSLASTALVPAAQAAPMPSKQAWLHDTVVALSGARPYVADRAARGGRKLALNLDIDNTSLQTYYDAGKRSRRRCVWRGTQRARASTSSFNTGRNVKMRDSTIRQLRRAGFPVDGLCAHYKGESLAQSKQRCRRSFVNNGFTLIANVGNRSTDFVGGNYERAYRLPNYGNRLG